MPAWSALAWFEDAWADGAWALVGPPPPPPAPPDPLRETAIIAALNRQYDQNIANAEAAAAAVVALIISGAFDG